MGDKLNEGGAAAGFVDPIFIPIGQELGKVTSQDLEDFGQDFASVFTGGETSEEEANRKAREKALELAYNKAMGYVEDQYYGAPVDQVKELQRWEALLSDPYSMSVLSADEVKELQNKVAGLKSQIEGKTTYEPAIYSPVRDYDVTGYDPTKVEAPSEAKVAYLLETMYPELLGIPEYEDAAMQGPSEAAKAQADAESLAAAKSALGSIEDVYRQGGMTEADKARLEQIQRANAMEARAAREAIMSDTAARGQSTSGNRLVSLLNASQNAANRNNQMGLGVEINAEERALNAMRDAGLLGRGLASDEFTRQFQTGSAADEINRFNTLGARDVQAATREAQDQYAQWNRDKIQRDVERLMEAGIINAEQATDAARYLADQTNLESQWGANTGNSAAKSNADRATEKGIYDADRAWEQLTGFNTQRSTLGNLELGRAGALNAESASQPTADYGQAVRNFLEFGKSGMELLGDPVSGKEALSGASEKTGGASALAFV